MELFSNLQKLEYSEEQMIFYTFFHFISFQLNLFPETAREDISQMVRSGMLSRIRSLHGLLIKMCAPPQRKKTRQPEQDIIGWLKIYIRLINGIKVLNKSWTSHSCLWMDTLRQPFSMLPAEPQTRVHIVWDPFV